MIERWFYGKLAVFDISESGREIGEKFVLLPDESQRKELAQYLPDNSANNVETTHSHLKHSWQQDNPLTEIRQGDLYVCLEHRLVIVRKQEISLTVKEFDILLLLIMNPGRVFKGQNTVNPIEIYFTYVGKIRLPLQKPELPASTEKPA